MNSIPQHQIEEVALPKAAIAMEDRELVVKCMQNDRLAQFTLYKKFYGKMISVCNRYTNNRDEALEILNAAFLKVFQNLNQYQEQGSFEGWIRRIVVYTAIDQVRSRVKYKEYMVMEEFDANVPASVVQELYTKDLLNMLNELPENMRMVFNLFAIEGYKYHEIHSMLNISEGTCKWYVSEARKILKTRITQYHKLS
jgi:RNA polymerase sigma-70 factor (ECF subfamily)